MLFGLSLLLFYSIISRAIARTNRRRTSRQWWCLRRVILARDSMQIGRAWPRCASTRMHTRTCTLVATVSCARRRRRRTRIIYIMDATHISRPRGPLINRLSAFLSRGRPTNTRMTLYLWKCSHRRRTELRHDPHCPRRRRRRRICHLGLTTTFRQIKNWSNRWVASVRRFCRQLYTVVRVFQSEPTTLLLLSIVKRRLLSLGQRETRITPSYRCNNITSVHHGPMSKHHIVPVFRVSDARIRGCLHVYFRVCTTSRRIFQNIGQDCRSKLDNNRYNLFVIIIMYYYCWYG